MKNLAIILAVAVLVVYVFIAVNERQKEHVIRMRLPKFRKINKYEFDKALYQIREVRTRKVYPTPRETVQKEQETDTRNDFYKDYDYIENMKNAPATDVQPIQEPATDYYQQQQPAQQEETQQGQAAVQQQGIVQQQGAQPQGQEAVQQAETLPQQPMRKMNKQQPGPEQQQ